MELEQWLVLLLFVYVTAIALNIVINKSNGDKKKKKKSNLKIENIDTMSGEEFEIFLKDLFESLGYDVSLTSKSGDQGADLILERYEKRKIVQAKRHSQKVSNKAIQEALGAVKYYDADEGLVITNNYFTDSAKKLARKSDIDLWDREKLKRKT